MDKWIVTIKRISPDIITINANNIICSYVIISFGAILFAENTELETLINNKSISIRAHSRKNRNRSDRIILKNTNRRTQMYMSGNKNMTMHSVLNYIKRRFTTNRYNMSAFVCKYYETYSLETILSRHVQLEIWSRFHPPIQKNNAYAIVVSVFHYFLNSFDVNLHTKRISSQILIRGTQKH